MVQSKQNVTAGCCFPLADHPFAICQFNGHPPPTAPQRHSGTCSEKERGIRGAAREGRSLGLEPELEVFSSVQNQVSEKKVKQEKDAAEQSIRSRDTASGTPQSEESAFLDTGAGAAGALLRPSKQSKTLRGIK